MDPLLERLLPADARRRRITIAVAVGVAAVVLAIATALAAAGAGGSSAPLPAVRTATTAASEAGPVLVQIAGAVRRPGVVEVTAGARVLDAVAAAGGATAKADLGAVALAAPVTDGQRIVVPERGAAASAAPGATAATGTTGARISLGTATAEQLETLPRIGPAMAARIIAWRSAHGGFRTVADLQQVTGIGPKTYAALKDLVEP